MDSRLPCVIGVLAGMTVLHVVLLAVVGPGPVAMLAAAGSAAFTAWALDGFGEPGDAPAPALGPLLLAPAAEVVLAACRYADGGSVGLASLMRPWIASAFPNCNGFIAFAICPLGVMLAGALAFVRGHPAGTFFAWWAACYAAADAALQLALAVAITPFASGTSLVAAAALAWVAVSIGRKLLHAGGREHGGKLALAP